MNVQGEINRLQEMLHLRNYNQDPPVDLYDPEESDDYMEVPFDDEQILRQHYTAHVTPPPLAYTLPPPFLTTMEPADTLLIGDEVISTTLTRENDEFIKSSVDDFVPIPRESEVTSVSIDLECGMPIDTPPSPYLVVLGDEKIDLLLRDDLDTLLTGDREIDINPCRDIEELERLLANDLVPVPRVFDEPLGNSDSMSRSIETSDLILEELTTKIGLDDSIPTEIDDSLREVERFDPYFSLTQSGGKTRVMETPSFGFHHMPSPRPAAYSPKEVMYRYYHPHLTSGDGFDHEIKKIPSDESKVHIEVLSVLRENRLPILDGSFPLSR
ncbi:hypothetical protein Tco_0705893 [Tanacetum coccineum]|uniref:Reverse transcriptase domain-containing protein n=1 Tax=Tanacetum coccineum TaxID=301880 RepID=A0ABQ4Y6R5_9ASTR